MSESLAEFAGRLGRLSSGDLNATLRRVVLVHALEAEGRAKLISTTVLRRRTGRLSNSIAGTMRADGATIDLVLRAGGGSAAKPVRYAAIHEFGGEIRGRPFLRIPMAGALTNAGVDRHPGSLRGDPRFRVQRSEDGHLFIVQAKAGGGRTSGAPLYRLVQRVTIPRRPYLAPAIDATRELLKAGLLTAIGASIRGGSSGN